jgi:RHS repeat-associated protein
VVVYKLGPPQACPSGWSRVSGATRAAHAHLPGTSWNAGALGAAVAANDKLVAVVMTSNPTLVTTSSISDSLGNTWSKDLTPITWTDGGWLGELSVWSAVSAAGTPSNITVAFTGSVDGVSISVAAYRGLSTSTGTAGVDLSRIASGSGGGTNAASSGTTSATTTAASELKLGFYGDQAGVTQTLAAGTLDTAYTFVTKDDNNGYAQTLIEEASSGASGSTARATATPPSGSPLWGMAVVVYKLAPPSGGGSDHFTLGYDGLERLTTIGGPVAESFTLDGGSNITARTGPSKTFSIDGSNRPTSDGTNTLTWNNADRLTGRGADSFGFDPLDRLTSSTVAGTSRTYSYGGDGLLQSRTQGGSTTTLLWDPATSPSRLLVSGSDRIVYGLGPLYSVNGTTVTTYARDGQKSIRAQLSGTSVTASWRYRAYGEIAQSNGASTPSLLGYVGQLLDPSGLYYLRARWYEVGSGRFMSRDPAGGAASSSASSNAFAYAAGNPARLSDPSGLDPFLESDEGGVFWWPPDPTVMLRGILAFFGIQYEFATGPGPEIVDHTLGAGATASIAGVANDLVLAEQHLASIAGGLTFAPNRAMLDLIHAAIGVGRPLSQAERNFLDHELLEAQYVRDGMTQAQAHEAVYQVYPPGSNYSPDVMRQLPEYFNAGDRSYWGIKR